MRWFVVRVLGIWIVLVASVGVARWIGSRQSAGRLLSRLHLTDCELPCWIDIVPGITTLDEARDRITAVYGQTYDLRMYDSADLGWAYADITESPGRLTGDKFITISFGVDEKEPHIIQSISLRNFALPTIAELIGVLGSPSQIQLPPITNEPNFWLSYGSDKYRVMIEVPSDVSPYVEWKYPATSLYISSVPNAGRAQCQRDQLQRWRGFIAQKSYLGDIGLC